MGAVTPPALTVVSVAYNSMDVLPGMAKSLPEGTPIVIVDNGPDDGLRTWAREAGHRLIVPSRNVGFGAGCNLGAEECSSEFVLFLNPDARVADGAIDTLLHVASEHPEAAALGPEFTKAGGGSYRYRPSKILPRSARMVRASRPTGITRVPSLNGAGLLCRRAAFEAVGGFDKALFLFFEDDDLTLRLSSEVGPLLYVPMAKFHHGLGGSSAPSAETEKLKGYHYAWSHSRVLKKHGRPFHLLIPLLGAARRFLSLKVLKSQARRAYAKGRLHGALDAWHGRDWR